MELNLDQKFAKALLVMRDLRPFYSAVYESIPHEETKSIDTMAVDCRALYYNKDFSDKLEFPEFMFVLLHEVGHIALMHVPRLQGRYGKLWNIACDLYVNKVLSLEFMIQPGDIDESKTVKFLKGALYCRSIDVGNDTVEGLYDILASQAVKNGFFDSESGEFAFSIRGKLAGNSKYDTYNFVINKETYSFDMVDNGCDAQEQESDNKAVISEASTKYDMMYSGVGNSSGILSKYSRALLKSQIDWKTLLRKYCITLTSRDTSYMMPDKRMYYQKAIYPGNVSESELVLRGVKICFDRSGSISEKDMQYFYGQVRDILEQYKVEAEVINWDTQILSTGTLTSCDKISHADIIRGGGTSPDCIFEYYESKKCKIKPYVSVIFTDGYVAFTEKPKWCKKYKNTIWVMTRNYNHEFKPKFGKLAIAKFND